MTLVALPVLAAQQLSAGAAQLGYLRALETVPYLVLALPAGQLADRFPPLRLMVAADAARAVLLSATTVLALAGALRLGLLYLVVALVGVCTAGYDVAQFTMLPALVPPARLVPATSAVELARGAAFTAGPGLGGLLTALLPAAPVLLVDAASYLASAPALTTLRHHRHPPRAAPVQAEQPLRRALGGARFVLRTGLLRALTAYLGVNNACNQAFLTGLIAYLEVDQRRPATEVGLAFGAYGAGFLLAAAVAPRLGRLLGPRPNVIGSSVISASGVGVLALSTLAAPGSAAALIAAAGGALFAALPATAAFTVIAAAGLLATGILLAARLPVGCWQHRQRQVVPFAISAAEWPLGGNLVTSWARVRTLDRCSAWPAVSCAGLGGGCCSGECR